MKYLICLLFSACLLLDGGDSAAAEPLQLRVLSYNIHHGEGIDRKLDLDRIAGVIKSAKPDLVALQEVDEKARRTGSVDQPAELARLTGMHVYFGGNIPLEGGRYGNAVLSKFPIEQPQNHLLPLLGEKPEQRGVIDCTFSLPTRSSAKPSAETEKRAVQLRFLATHLDARTDDRERLASAKAINDLASGAPDQAAILAGDLNATPQSEPLAILGKLWKKAGEQPALTSGSVKPSRQIDYILLRPAASWKVIEVRVLDESIASDHRPILAVLELDVAETKQSRGQ